MKLNNPFFSFEFIEEKNYSLMDNWGKLKDIDEFIESQYDGFSTTFIESVLFHTCELFSAQMAFVCFKENKSFLRVQLGELTFSVKKVKEALK